jgi:membrane-bound lytic murein transglycosylase MltF
MLERHQIRFLVVYNKMMYFLDRATQRGATYELARLFERRLNRLLNRDGIKIQAIFIPVPRDELISALQEGRGDVIAANLTITPSRQAEVTFTDPLMTGISEVVVTNVQDPPLRALEGLSGRTVYVRVGSSYAESLEQLNEDLQAEGLAPVQLMPVAPYMEDSDLLEMLNAGLISTVVVDDYKARFWAKVFPNLRVQADIAVNTGGKFAWAIRHDSPQLLAFLNDFVAEHKEGTLYGNLLQARYLEDNRWVRNNLELDELQKFTAVLDLLKEYADRYQLDWLMVAALAYQESGLDHGRRSPRGAVGIMQVMPSTAADANVDIPEVESLECNIHAGVKYLRFVYDRYFAGEPMDDLDKMLFAFAAYNAGPAQVQRLREEAQAMGLDPSRWFRNVELAAAKLMGSETVQYVANIYKYYTAYRLIVDRLHLKDKAAGF